MRALCGPARAGIARGILIAFLAALGCADKAFGEIITHLQPICGASGIFSDTASYSIAEINAAGGIAIGNNIFDSFSVTPSASAKASSPTAASIWITGFEINGDYGFKVDSLWTASSKQWVDDSITFHASLLEESVAQGHAFHGNALYVTAVGGGIRRVGARRFPRAFTRNTRVWAGHRWPRNSRTTPAHLTRLCGIRRRSPLSPTCGLSKTLGSRAVRASTASWH